MTQQPWDDPELIAKELREAIRDIEASGGPGVFRNGVIHPFKLVIAPNFRQFKRFVYEERCRLTGSTEPIEFRYVNYPEQLMGYRGELVIVNADQCDLHKFASALDARLVHALRDSPEANIRWVDL
ncbi:MAG TPA: hypothetical protein VGR71_16615 [Nitrospira sp.]|nr:hypothetical protein [Nitrospira sp.]